MEILKQLEKVEAEAIDTINAADSLKSVENIREA